MKYFINNFKAIFGFFLLLILNASSVLAQTTEETTTTNTGFNIPLNYVLLAVALILACLILILVNTTKNAIDLFKSNNPDITKKKIISAILILLFSTQLLHAQDVATTQTLDYSKVFTFILVFLILIEVFFILYLIKSIEFFSGIKAARKNSKEQTLWEKINKFQDISKEDNLDVGHNYDGIRELDNITPPWFAFGFVASMIIGIIYIYQFNVTHRIPSQYVELENAMQTAKAEQGAFLASSNSAVDENNVKMLDDAGIANGAAIFKTNCQICHGANGEGVSAPNLTDNYWLHGGSMNDVYHTIKYGVLEKGMTPWESMLSPTEINEVASFVKSLKGTNPPNAKAPEGDLFEDASAEQNTTTAATTDTTTVEG